MIHSDFAKKTTLHASVVSYSGGLLLIDMSRLIFRV